MSSAIRNYALVTSAYWGFTLTDGALRMLVLLHFNALGYSAFEIALLFVLYECAGVVTNLVGGWLAQVRGLRFTLFAGLILQIGALSALSLTNPDWLPWISVAYVMGLQAASGVAKDLTKMSSKSAIKVLVPKDADGALFRWVALLTGSKNALKGAGFFMGGVLLAWLGFSGALLLMAAGLTIILIAVALSIGSEMTTPAGKTKAKFRDVFSKDRKINVLSAARLFLFGSRDIWFVVGLPVFLATKLGWDHIEIGTYMAAWVIGYGVIQAIAPKLLRAGSHAPDGRSARLWIFGLVLITVLIALAVQFGVAAEIAVLGGLLVFGLVFAVNSSLHSYLILAYADGDKVAMNVGFYYMSNAIGRLTGTILSGLAYMYGGLVGCLVASAAFLLVGWVISFALPDAKSAAA
ncbi:organoarsenical effux MFS transporter ArsJ [Thalassospira alkalitolerans]|uniref:MFS transporter permease n=1 Tax=Thalassospira alkalitolerans TaxID=1293890 RepID=A0A1Y2L9M3_9PROT|nr:organoarsenical effux MFS transporter ArsJ [Thalassospira alkalitolerans]OSQ47168.1 MFS transporter permease [Thalassospira alkalitolerans]